MFRNTGHPDYDLTMEVLLCIPLYPTGAFLNILARDLDLDGQKEITRLMARLRKKYRLDVVVGNGDRKLDGRGGRMAFVKQGSWAKARELANDYWRKVYA